MFFGDSITVGQRVPSAAIQVPYDDDTYDDIIMRIPDWLVYHRLNEAASPFLDYTGHGYNATYVGTQQLQALDGPGSTMGKAPQYSGDDTFTYYNAGIGNVGSPGAFDPTAFGFFIWVRSNGNWSGRIIGFRVDPVDGANRILLYCPSATQLSGFYSAGGAAVAVTATVSQNTWHCIGLTGNKSLNRFRMYVDGAQVGTDQAMTGTWAGNINANCMCWFAETSSPLGSPYTGYGYRGGIINGREPSAAEIATIATPK